MIIGELVRCISEKLTNEYGIAVSSELFQKGSSDVHIRVFEKQSDLFIGFTICLSWRKIKLAFCPRYVITNSHVYQQWIQNIRENRGAFDLYAKRLKGQKLQLRYQVNQEAYEVYPDLDDCAFFSVDATSGYFEVRDNLDFYAENIIPVISNFWGLILSFSGVFELEELPEEGKMHTVQTTKYERNSVYRKLCIEHYGCTCQICGENLFNKYGEIAKGFIEVHHIEPVSEYAQPKVISPISDLLPVCPNCHAMLHRKKPAYLPLEVKAMLDRGIQK